MASVRQTKLYTHQVTVYRETRARAADKTPIPSTGSIVDTGVLCYLETGKSAQTPADYVLDENDNSLTYDTLHAYADAPVLAGDVLQVTAGPYSGKFYTVRGEPQIRTFHANKLMADCSRLTDPPKWVRDLL